VETKSRTAQERNTGYLEEPAEIGGPASPAGCAPDEEDGTEASPPSSTSSGLAPAAPRHSHSLVPQARRSICCHFKTTKRKNTHSGSAGEVYFWMAAMILSLSLVVNDSTSTPSLVLVEVEQWHDLDVQPIRHLRLLIVLVDHLHTIMFGRERDQSRLVEAC
jgi:hypothetical protein